MQFNTKTVLSCVVAGLIVGSVAAAISCKVKNNELTSSLTAATDKLQTASELIATQDQALAKRDALLAHLFGAPPAETWKTVSVEITWYSLSEDECDEDPLTAAAGPSKPFMVALTPRVKLMLNIEFGDKIAVISDDGKVAAVVTYWDAFNSRYDNDNKVDIVAPRKEIARWLGTRKGRLVKIT